MLKVNEYFEGAVKSVGFTRGNGTATVGVMAPGAYEFNTGAPELMRVIEGSLTVLLPGKTEWETFPEGTEFKVAASSSFKLKVSVDTAYLCLFL